MLSKTGTESERNYLERQRSKNENSKVKIKYTTFRGYVGQHIGLEFAFIIMLCLCHARQFAEK
jgi:hypothetical protein